MSSPSSNNISDDNENTKSNEIVLPIKGYKRSILKEFSYVKIKKPKKDDRKIKLNNPELLRLSTVVYRKAAKTAIKKLQKALLPERLRKSEISNLQGELEEFLKEFRSHLPDLMIPARRTTIKEYEYGRENLEEEVEELRAKEKVTRKIHNYLLDELKAKREKVKNLTDVVLTRLELDVASFKYTPPVTLPKTFEYATKNSDLQSKPDAFRIFKKQKTADLVTSEEEKGSGHKRSALDLFISDKVKSNSRVFHLPA